jgi:hypothetical protein
MTFMMMGNAIINAGGNGDIESYKKMSIEDFVHMFAVNGIRMVYMPEKHMDSIKIAWEATTPAPPPKKKQLLCDVHDKYDGTEYHTE